MIKTEKIQKIVKLCLLSGFIKGEKPLSLLVVSKSGNGKTESISQFNIKTARFVTDLSYIGLVDLLKKHPKLKHIIIPDFLKITQKKRSTSDNLISFLNAVLEEGAGLIKLYNLEHDFKGRTLGLIIATTKASFQQKRNNWESIGFVDRMLKCSYDYTDETINEIFSFINEELYRNSKRTNLKSFKVQNIESTKELNKQLNKFSNKKFRNLKQLQTLAKCCALDRGSSKVEQKDINEVIDLCSLLNLNYTKL